MHKELVKLSHKAWMEFLKLYREHPVGPSSTDYEAWLKTRPELKARFDNSGKINTKMSETNGSKSIVTLDSRSPIEFRVEHTAIHFKANSIFFLDTFVFIFELSSLFLP